MAVSTASHGARRAAARPPHPGDIGRRVTMRREQLGLTREEVAAQAGMATSYLQYLEEQPADVSAGALARLAGVLQTTVGQLRGARADVPPGRGPAASRPGLVELSPEQCRDRLSTHGVGRVAVSTPRGIAVIPVNYTVVDDAIIYRTAPDTVSAVAPGTEAAFEVDEVDEALGQGWSVLVVGTAEQITEPDAVRRLAEHARVEPWAGGTRDLWVRVAPERVTGRRIQIG